MKLLGVGIMLLGMFGAISARSFENQSPSFGEGSSPYTESTFSINVCFHKQNEQENMFNYELQGLKDWYTGKTSLVNQSKPEEQRFVIQHKEVPELKVAFRVHFTEKELRSGDRFCTSAITVEKNSRDALLSVLGVLLIASPFAIIFG